MAAVRRPGSNEPTAPDRSAVPRIAMRLSRAPRPRPVRVLELCGPLPPSPTRATFADVFLRQKRLAAPCRRVMWPSLCLCAPGPPRLRACVSLSNSVSLCLCGVVSLRPCLCVCVSVPLCLCAFVALCLCGPAPLCLCGVVSLWPCLCVCVSVPLCLCAFVARWPGGPAPLCLCSPVSCGPCATHVCVSLCLCGQPLRTSAPPWHCGPTVSGWPAPRPAP